MINKTCIVGRLGQDPKIISDKCVSLSVATDRYDSAEKKRITDWHNVLLIGKNAQKRASLVSKGSWVAIDGHLQSSKKDGKYYYQVVTFDIGIFERSPSQCSEVDSGSTKVSDKTEEYDDNVPF